MRVARLPDRQATLCKKDRKDSRFSFVVSKKAAKLAVARNKLRRTGYDTIQKNILHIKEDLLVAVFIKKSAAGLSKKELEEEILSLLQKANLLKTKSKYDQKNSH